MSALVPRTSLHHALFIVALSLGLSIFLLSFFLPAVGNLSGFECANFALRAWDHDDEISSLSLFGGWLNPQVVLLFFLSAFRIAPRVRSLLTVTILSSIPLTWLAIHRMAVAGMFMELRIGHFLWIAGILLILLPNLQSALSYRFARILGAVGAIVIAYLSFPLLVTLTMHPASDRDDFLYVVAWTLQEPALCAKISPNAIGRDDQRDSTDPTYMQSDCYRNVAAELHKPQLCKNVKSTRADRLVGSILAKYNCRKQRYTVGSALPGTGPNFVGTMRSVALDDDQLAEFLYGNRPDNVLLPILNTLHSDPSFLSRLNASASYDEPFAPDKNRDAHPLEFVDEMVAIQWDLPSLCQKISPNARVRNVNAFAGSLQGACLSDIAFNRGNDALCSKLPGAQNVLQTNQAEYREGCMKHVALLRDPGFHRQWGGHYGPAYFPTWPQFQEAARLLGYPATAPWLQLPRPTPEQYTDYLFYLAWPEHRADRNVFVQRILASK